MSEIDERPNPTGQEPTGKRPRPRFQRVERSFSSDSTNERAFRPHGFAPQGGYSKGGYQSRGGYQNNDGGYQRNRGYINRDGYNNQGEYNQDRSYHRDRGYQDRNDQNGYSDYSSQDRPRPRGGYQLRQGGFQNHGGYHNGYQGSYQGRPGQGDSRHQGSYNNRQGGYGQRPRKPYNPNDKYSLKKQIEYKEYLEDPNAPIRLNKFLANAGVCSRREADEYIQAGVVRVNGNIVTELGTKVQRTDEVHFHDQLISLEKKVYVLLNKPKDYVTTSDDPQARKTVLDLVKNCCKERIYPVGRLDRNTTGVLLFTNDGELASKLSHPKYLKKKVYHVHLDKNCTINDLKTLSEGIQLEDGEIHADAIEYASDTDRKQVGIEIHSGKNRIVRRMFEFLGYRVIKLDRVMFAGLTKKGLKRGDWRFLTEQEVAMLHMNTQD